MNTLTTLNGKPHSPIRAFKVFRNDWTCRGFQYKVGETYEHGGDVRLCHSGFHACVVAAQCFQYYSFDPRNRVAEVELSGTIVGSNEDKHAASRITIVREVAWEEVLRIANTGIGNSGYRNSGYGNSGYGNSGDRNSGHSNSGHSNSGHSNSGHRNSGYGNSGDGNSGDWNSGCGNSGDWNSGCGNSGDWNSADRCAGYFNTERPNTVRCFGVEVKRSEWEKAHKPVFLYFSLNQWVESGAMTDDEKDAHPNHVATGGFLRRMNYKEAFRASWDSADPDDRERVRDLPGFDADIFYQISGIDLRGTEASE
ncbi:MAG: hypothetical protein AAFU38_11955 [Bacteroidota bacterium]